MQTDLKLRDLWEVLSPNEIEDGCRCLLETTEKSGKATRRQVLDALATALRFRPLFLLRRPMSENLPLLVKRIGMPEFTPFQGDVIRAWLVHHHRPILTAFLDASGIPQKNGFVDGEPPTPAASQFETGIARVLAQFKARDVGLYLGYLVIFGEEFWFALAQALEAKSVHINDLLKPEQPGTVPKPVAPVAEPAAPTLPEDSDEFTTLDNWLIQAAVASAFGESGALTQDQVEDLVEEVTELNAKRQHTLFHRGYLHALFEKPLTVHFPGENEDRRLWYFTGALFGLLRSHKNDEVLRLLEENPDLASQLCENRKVRCGSMILQQVHPILWEAKEFGMLQRWLGGQIVRLTPDRRADLMVQIHFDAASLVRRGQWAEAEGFLDFLDDFVRKADGLPEGFKDGFMPANDRKRAQVLQLKGEFQEAEALLKPLSEGEMIDDAGNALCDRALMMAGFRSLAAVLPGKEEQSGKATGAALEKGRALLEQSVRQHPASSTNAHFCLGLITLQTNAPAQTAADHFKSALAGMLKKEEAYTEGGLIQWTRFLLGLALLENAETADLQHARDYIEQAIETPVAFPLWLWSRAMQAATLFDDKTLGQQIAEHLLKKRGSAAYHVIWQSGLAVSVASLRQTYLMWMEGAPLPSHDKWSRLKTMLPAALLDGDISQAETILDTMEGIAIQAVKYQTEFLLLLEDDCNYSPAWDFESAVHSRIKFHELAGNLIDATALLRTRFFALREKGDLASVREAEAVLERMQDAGADSADIEQLRSLLPQSEPRVAPDGCRLKVGVPVRVLYIGGNEIQAAYETEIRSELAKSHPSLKVEFYYPGWNSNWNVHFRKVEPKILQSDAVVLSTMVRTQFGCRVRVACNAMNPWFPCTGKGKKSLKRSIEAAAIWAANNKKI